MQKQAWIHSLAPITLGAVCVLLRWLQNMNVFDAETALAVPHHPLSVLLALLLLFSALALRFLNHMLRDASAAEEPEKAMTVLPQPLAAVIAMAGLIAAGGCVLSFFTGVGVVARLTALLGLLSVPALLLFPYLHRWGALGAWLSLNPVAFFSVWLVVAYREYAKDPVVWSYAPLMLAIAGALYAAYRLSGYFFYRAQPMKVLFACTLASVLCMTVLMDTSIGAGRLILAGWAVGFAAITGLLVLNMSEVLPEYDVDDEYE
ncbi:MAG: hypothetical protein MJ074_09445 [Oscillospiraceae bacterium]|nr:hypothetical protein [Oscillospiraceae bacterium]